MERIMASFPPIEEFEKRYGMAIDDPDLERVYEKHYESFLEYNTMKHEYENLGFEKGFEAGMKAAGYNKGYE